MKVKGQILDLTKFKLSKEPFVVKIEIPGVLVVRRPRFGDLRGAFQELWRIKDIKGQIKKDLTIHQSMISSSNPGVIRGLHAENQTKLMTPLSGKISIVLLDLRKSSKAKFDWVMLKFDNENKNLHYFYTLVVPPGVANSLCIYGKQVGMNLYGMGGVFDPKNAGRGVSMFDPVLKGIPWQIKLTKAIISDRDKSLPSLAEAYKLINSH